MVKVTKGNIAWATEQTSHSSGFVVMIYVCPCQRQTFSTNGTLPILCLKNSQIYCLIYTKIRLERVYPCICKSTWPDLLPISVFCCSHGVSHGSVTIPLDRLSRITTIACHAYKAIIPLDL